MMVVLAHHVLLSLLFLYQLVCGEDMEKSTPSDVANFRTIDLTSNIQEWENDMAILFYAPWCEYCKQIQPTWATIAALKEDSKVLQVGTFNCEASADHTDICQEFGVDRYPSVFFLGFGNFNQAKGGHLFGSVKNPRVVRYEADLYPSAIYDWVNTMASLSAFHRKWEDFTGIFTGNTRSAKQIKRLKERVQAAEGKVVTMRKELEQHQANEVFDELVDHGDPFEVLHSLAPDEMNLPLRVCVGEMAEEYCRYYPAEKYCKIVRECALQDLAPVRCRPDRCPFEGSRGCRAVSVCMEIDVIKQYQDALAKTAKR